MWPMVLNGNHYNNELHSRERPLKRYPAKHLIAPFTLRHQEEKSHVRISCNRKKCEHYWQNLYLGISWIVKT